MIVKKTLGLLDELEFLRRRLVGLFGPVGIKGTAPAARFCSPEGTRKAVQQGMCQPVVGSTRR
jgi:hypothetical protein